MDRWKKVDKELSQFNNKKPEELELEFVLFDLDNSYPSSPFKGRNIVNLDFVYKQLLDGHKACKTILWPGFHYTANATTTTQKQSDYKIEQSSFTLIALF